MCFTQNHDFERPGRPPRTNDQERRVLEDNPLILLLLQLRVVFQHVTSAVILPIFLQLLELLRWLIWQARSCPYLSMRMRVRTAHCRALVLEYLHPSILCVWGSDCKARGSKHCRLGDFGERGLGGQVGCVDLCPSLNDRQYLGGGEVGERKIMRGRECQNVAFPRN